MNYLKVWAVLLFGAAQLTAGRSVTGIVRVTGGGPAAGVRVMAMVVPSAGRGGVNGQSVLARLTQTDKDGRYLLEDIPPGRYFIAAGAVASPTFYPGTLLQNEARVITITQDGPSLSGIDISLSAASTLTSTTVNLSSSSRPCCNLSGLLLTEDGSPLPVVPLKVAETGSNTRVAVDDGFFRLFLQRGTTAQFAVEGLPPGYSLKSIVYGGVNAAQTLQIDGREPQALLLMISAQPGSALPKVTARGKIENIASELKTTNLSLVLTSTLSGGAAFVAPIQQDYSFELSDIPVGSYRVGIRTAERVWSYPKLAVIRDAVSDLRIDFGDNPFPDLGDSLFTPGLFADGKETTLTGVATQRLKSLGSSSRTAYFRLNVKDGRTGVMTTWAIHVADSNFVPNIAIGETYTVTGTLAPDGTKRLKAKPF